MTKLSDSYLLVFYISGYILATFQIFAVSFYGDKVAQESLKVSRVCYEIDFIGTDSRFQKSLLLIIWNCQQPVQFTIGKLGVLSLDTFVGVCIYYTLLVLKLLILNSLQISNASYSYFNILRNLRG